jgi:hypothetical protein
LTASQQHGEEQAGFEPIADLLDDLLSGLSEDMLHPSDQGMIEIATKLVLREPRAYIATKTQYAVGYDGSEVHANILRT